MAHARLHYLDTIDRQGRFDAALTANSRVWFGVPAFLYREFGTHLANWLKNVLMRRWSAAFFEECRLRYLSSYFMLTWMPRHGPACRRPICVVTRAPQSPPCAK